MKIASIFVLLLLLTVSSQKKKQKKSVKLKNAEDDEDNASLDSNVVSNGLNLEGAIRRQYALETAIMFNSKNMICSPLSALIPLGKLALGAKGVGLKEILGAIGIRKKSQVKMKLKSLIRNLLDVSGVKLNVVSTIYVSKNAELNPHFEKSAKDVFHSTVEKLDFADQEASANVINQWVNKETNGKIPNIIEPSQISPQASLILVNAIYFSGEWMHPFTHTMSAEFHTEDGAIQLPTMEQENQMMYYRSKVLDAEIVEIPYKEGYVSFFAVVPKEKDGLNVLINQLKLTPELLDEEARKMQSKLIKLFMPRFKIETKMNMGDLYKKVGIKKIFTEDSGLKELVLNTDVQVSSAIQKAMIEVTESGTEAAAASVTFIVGSSMILNPPTPKIVRLDRPFMFFITAETEQIFAGFFTARS